MNHLSITYRKEGGDVNAHISGSFSSTAALKINNTLHEKVDPWERLIIDLTRVTDMDTTGLNILFQTNLRCIHKNVKMILRCQESHPINNLLQLTHSARAFDMQWSD